MTVPDIVEVGPRDGLQNESRALSPAVRLDLIGRLAACGLKRIEAAACVSPAKVPQMAGYEEVLSGLPRGGPASYSALVANERGLQAALAAGGASEIALFTAASDEFARRNIGCSVEESLDRFAPLAREAKESGLRARGYVSTAVRCPYEGDVDPERAAAVAARLAEMGCWEVSLADTLGLATPRRIRSLMRAARRACGPARLAAHLHDTAGSAIANIACALEEGAVAVDSSAAGLGGCPFAPGAAGNVATEDVAHFLEGEGLSIGLDLDYLAATGRWICGLLGRPYLAKAGLARRGAAAR